jgi:hypothetical protein
VRGAGMWWDGREATDGEMPTHVTRGLPPRSCDRVLETGACVDPAAMPLQLPCVPSRLQQGRQGYGVELGSGASTVMHCWAGEGTKGKG